jgi:bloom syndrome protein
VDDPPKYKKDIEEGLRAWIETEGCRRDVVDEYFDNPAV